MSLYNLQLILFLDNLEFGINIDNFKIGYLYNQLIVFFLLIINNDGIICFFLYIR